MDRCDRRSWSWNVSSDARESLNTRSAIPLMTIIFRITFQPRRLQVTLRHFKGATAQRCSASFASSAPARSSLFAIWEIGFYSVYRSNSSLCRRAPFISPGKRGCRLVLATNYFSMKRNDVLIILILIILRVTPRDAIKLHDVTERPRDRFSASDFAERVYSPTLDVSLKGWGSTLCQRLPRARFSFACNLWSRAFTELCLSSLSDARDNNLSACPTWTRVLELLRAAAIKKILLISATLNTDACDCRGTVLLKLLLNSDMNKEIGLHE